MNEFSLLDQRPIIIALAGHNGAGKTTFFHSHLQAAGLRFFNADEVARELGLGAYEAAEVVAALRRKAVSTRESFVFETVPSDPVGEKVKFLKQAAEQGYAPVLIFIGLANPKLSEQRVHIRVLQGEQDVPREKLHQRFPRTLGNLKLALQELRFVIVYDNSYLNQPYQRVAVFENGTARFLKSDMPSWFRGLIRVGGGGRAKKRGAGVEH